MFTFLFGSYSHVYVWTIIDKYPFFILPPPPGLIHATHDVIRQRSNEQLAYEEEMYTIDPRFMLLSDNVCGDLRFNSVNLSFSLLPLNKHFWPKSTWYDYMIDFRVDVIPCSVQSKLIVKLEI